MARICSLSGKRPRSGYSVSHSQQRTKRWFTPNVHTKRVFNPATGTFMKVTLAASALRTLAKWQKAGKTYDLRKLIEAK
ncbi:MAG TPA: 50S ribosomal protein L28 [Patescibacteria group bacterium]|uniref:Large ribosomal subunit protein bL28 n=1 Tax=Candidatus Kaiserbacteria bacterium RIFCSPHIGHO2_01_FULL_54_36b TaxID=1798483 RepID=A0A1F6CN72_9BACT|nr:MAG: 50S ribosomal protein L28 [Candidatus Kaiserbacteria bacterium RIFCSPHIGHO2_01_FULL_54_36b]HLB50912.1 50S ribosomal protein L28 [Patescibacteria group bacterium]